MTEERSSTSVVIDTRVSTPAVPHLRQIGDQVYTVCGVPTFNSIFVYWPHTSPVEHVPFRHPSVLICIPSQGLAGGNVAYHCSCLRGMVYEPLQTISSFKRAKKIYERFLSELVWSVHDWWLVNPPWQAPVTRVSLTYIPVMNCCERLSRTRLVGLEWDCWCRHNVR